MMPSRGLLRARAYATLVDSTADKRARAQAHLAAVDTRNGTHVSPILVDSFGRGHDYLRISLTERCNLRCTYCMPEDGVDLTPKQHLLTNDEVVRLARLFASQGVTKIRLTGGEPTLRKDLTSLVEQLSAIGSIKSLGMTSNGITLARRLPELVKAGLTGVNLSLDTLDPLKFELMTRRRGYAAVLRALESAISHLPPPGLAPVLGQHLSSVKVNVVVIKGVNDGEIGTFANLARDRRVDVRFIEYMPFDGNRWSSTKLVRSSDLLGRLESDNPGLTPRLQHASDTSKAYAGPGWRGTVGFISSMTDHFCAGCSRLRLGADGGLKVCLFGPPKINLRALLRDGASDAELLEALSAAVKTKSFAHNGSRSGSVGNCSDAQSAHGDDRRLTGAFPLRIRRPIPAYAYSQRQVRTSSTAALTHVDTATGRPHMVDVGHKSPTKRSATACGSVWIDDMALKALKASSRLEKGDPLAVAQLAGIMAAKNASALIPLCHPVILDDIKVTLAVDETAKRILVDATVKCEGKTGVEMEALTAVTAACLTLWDMLKSVAGRKMRIGDILVKAKSGGKSGDWRRQDM